MGTPFMQERKYEQLKEEILYYQKETETKGFGYAFRWGLILTFFILAFDFIWSISVDKESMSAWITVLGWKRFAVSFIVYIAIFYLWEVRNNHRQLRNKKNELRKLLQQNPSLEKTTL